MTKLSVESRAVIVDAVKRARHERASEVGVDHLLSAVLDQAHVRSLLPRPASGLTADDLVAEVGEGQRRAGLSLVDVGVLAELGVDVTALVDRVEAQLGEGALDEKPNGRLRVGRGPSISDDFSKAVRAAARQARADGVQRVSAPHLLLGLLTQPGLIADTFGRHGITWATVREALEADRGPGSTGTTR